MVNAQPLSATKNELNLMFQLHIIDLGIAIPLQQVDQSIVISSSKTDNLSTQIPNSQQTLLTSDESSDFLVFTLDQTTISACSCDAIISSGSFEGFCLRFAENFQHTNSNWKPARIFKMSTNTILNACCVPSGQYSMHSRAKHTLNSKSQKWFLNVQWDMKGIDINMSSIIGKHFSQLIRTIALTQLIQTTDAVTTTATTNNNDISTNSNYSNMKSSSTYHIHDNSDPNEDDERRKRLEYEYSILGQRIARLK